MIKNKDVAIAVSASDVKKWKVYWTTVFDISGKELFKLEQERNFSDWSVANSFYQKKKGRAL